MCFFLCFLFFLFRAPGPRTKTQINKTIKQEKSKHIKKIKPGGPKEPENAPGGSLFVRLQLHCGLCSLHPTQHLPPNRSGWLIPFWQTGFPICCPYLTSFLLLHLLCFRFLTSVTIDSAMFRPTIYNSIISQKFARIR